MKTDFKFTEIMAVYNAEAYLEEALESLFHQTLGFESIQIILVDDGSTDGSRAICERWAERYPRSVLVLHQSNGGRASARNMGLRYAAGEYVSFLDPADKLSEDALERVYQFYQEHGKETNIVSIPIFLFGSCEGEHALNKKYAEGTRVIDLCEEYACIQLSCSASFYPLETAKSMDYDPALAQGADARENLKVLISKPFLGVVSEAGYWYRQYQESAVTCETNTPDWYLPYLNGFSVWALDYSERMLGTVPRFVQYTVLYELQSRIMQSHIPEPLQDTNHLREYKQKIDAILNRLDQEIILQMETLDSFHRFMLLRRISQAFSLDNTEQELRVCFNQNVNMLFDDLMTFEVCFLSVKNGQARIEGLVSVPTGLLNSSWKLYAVDSGDAHLECALHEVPAKETIFFLDEKICEYWGFSVDIPIAGREKINVSFQMIVSSGIVHDVTNILKGHYLPICPYQGGSGYQNGWQYRLDQNQIELMPCRTKRQQVKRELSVERMLLSMRARKALFYRWGCLLLRLFFRKRIWLVTDRIDRAGDNGEAFFRYLVSNPPKNVRPYFVIMKDAPDYMRMKAIGPTIAVHSVRHKLMTMMAECIISSGGREQWFDPFGIQSIWNKDILYSIPFFFLQHGITKDDVSKWLNRWNENIQGFVTSAIPEHRSIVEGDYDYQPDQIWLTGLPRYDRLEKKQEKKLITIMPTWRKYLMGQQDPSTGKLQLRDDFSKSDFCKYYSELLSHHALIKAAADLGYQIQFLPHPYILAGIHDIARDDAVTLAVDKSYADVFMESSIVVTDYSSVAFDFAYLRKPVIYYQFDSQEFFSGSHAYDKGYFDYVRDGFGPVCYDVETLVSTLIDLMKSDSILSEQYADRVNRFFSFSDQNNSRRVADHIVGFFAAQVDGMTKSTVQ